MFCGHHIFLNPNLGLKPCSVVIIWNSDLAANDVPWMFSATTRFLRTPDFPLRRMILWLVPTAGEENLYKLLLSPLTKNIWTKRLLATWCLVVLQSDKPLEIILLCKTRFHRFSKKLSNQYHIDSLAILRKILIYRFLEYQNSEFKRAYDYWLLS